jgi:hypothetical protein
VVFRFSLRFPLRLKGIYWLLLTLNHGESHLMRANLASSLGYVKRPMTHQ